MARAALGIAPLIRKGRAWLFVAPRGARKVRCFSNATIAHLIAAGEAVRVGNVVKKLSVCLCVASLLWSCVMPASARPIAISITKLSRMSTAERAALDNPHLQQPARAIVTVPVTSLAASTQAALVSMSSHPVAKAVTLRLRQSTVRYNVFDFTTLRQFGLAERDRDTPFHRLTDEGRGYALGCAKLIAKDLGIHEIWISETSRHDRTAHCTCGWSAHVYSRHLSNHATFAGKVQKHLAEVAHGTKGGTP